MDDLEFQFTQLLNYFMRQSKFSFIIHTSLSNTTPIQEKIEQLLYSLNLSYPNFKYPYPDNPVLEYSPKPINKFF